MVDYSCFIDGMTTKHVYIKMSSVENNNVAFKESEYIYWMYKAKCTHHRVAISKNGQMSIQLRFGIREYCLIIFLESTM